VSTRTFVLPLIFCLYWESIPESVCVCVQMLKVVDSEGLLGHAVDCLLGVHLILPAALGPGASFSH
jgi:Na+/pantothenate symporter